MRTRYPRGPIALSLVLALCLALAAAGCGSDGGDQSSGGGDGSASEDHGDRDLGRGVVTIRMVKVGDPGNPSVGVVSTFGTKGEFVKVPAHGGVYENCDEAPKGPPDCVTYGSVDRPYEIAQFEITVEDYVAFLNTADPDGRDQHRLYHDYMNPTVWPKFGSINRETGPGVGRGEHYSVAYPEWADKPFGFANFLRAARFVNSLDNGEVLSREEATIGGFETVTYEVRLSRETEKGMYDMGNQETEREEDSGFVIPSNDEWGKAAYYDPRGGGTDSYWLYPTGPSGTPPNASKLNPSNGEVVNRSEQPLATYSPEGPGARPGTYPTWCPSQAGEEACETVSPIERLPPGIPRQDLQGNLSTVGQAGTPSPWGTYDQGGNVVEWQDTIVPPPPGYEIARVWRRMHGGVANAAAYQMLIAAFGFQPQDQVVTDPIYPWFGFRVGVIGEPG